MHLILENSSIFLYSQRHVYEIFKYILRIDESSLIARFMKVRVSIWVNVSIG